MSVNIDSSSAVYWCTSRTNMLAARQCASEEMATQLELSCRRVRVVRVGDGNVLPSMVNEGFYTVRR